MIQEQQKIQIQKWKQTIQDPLDLTVWLSNDDISHKFESFCDLFTEYATCVHFHKKFDVNHSMPGIQITDQVIYHAIPTGPELSPFLELLSQTMQNHSKANTYIHQVIEFKLFIASQCAFCPITVSTLIPFIISDQISLTIIDAFLFPDHAQQYQIQSVPTVIIGNQFRLTGSIQSSDIKDAIIACQSDSLSMEMIERMISDGNANHLANIMLTQQKIFPDYIQALIHDQFSIRLGAMAVAETLAYENRQFASQLIPSLFFHFDHVQDTIKGDILYTIGEVGTSEHIPQLHQIAEHHNNIEVQESALEAIEKIKLNS